VSALMQVIAAFVAATLALVAIDLLWLGVIGRLPGQRRSGRALRAARKKLGVGLLACGFLAMGLVLLAINPNAGVEAATPSGSQRSSITSAASAPT
jgi:hypothetical protein